MDWQIGVDDPLDGAHVYQFGSVGLHCGAPARRPLAATVLTGRRKGLDIGRIIMLALPLQATPVAKAQVVNCSGYALGNSAAGRAVATWLIKSLFFPAWAGRSI